ncbi:gamma-type small acid-soluble spore protein [Ureibacillus sp. MALMAid1270]|uniref:gamma-type small acid-soluble spore protein n=1 Tax=Ureibacillus sp. MALMAid1270 TaxID=3411629 RepID=UPI003BA5F5C9
MTQQENKFTVAGTNIDEVKKLNAESGLSYNEVYALLAKTGGRGTSVYSVSNREKNKNGLNQ